MSNMMPEEEPQTPGNEADHKGLSTVSTYIPMLSPGSPFQISIHSWTTPEAPEALDPEAQAMVEARVFIDGVPIT